MNTSETLKRNWLIQAKAEVSDTGNKWNYSKEKYI